MQTAVVTDSSAELWGHTPRSVRVLPILLHVPSGDVSGYDEASLQTVYRSLHAGEAIKSSAPSPADYLIAIEETAADSVVVITPAEEFTSMLRNARIAAEMTQRRVEVIDSRTAAAAQGLVVRAAARAAESGGFFEEVVMAALRARQRAELVAKLGSLELLARTGRVRADVVDGAERLGVSPVFRLKQGMVLSVAMPRTVEGALRALQREWAAHGGEGTHECAIFHARRPHEATKLERLLGDNQLVVEFCPAMAVHTGEGVVGVAWLRRNGAGR